MKHDIIHDIAADRSGQPFFVYLHQILPRVEQLEYGAWSEERGFLRHAHEDLFQIDFFVAGLGIYRLDGAEHPIGPERVFVASPGAEHELRASPDEPLRGFSLKFQLPGFSEPFLPPMLPVDKGCSERIESLFRQAVSETVLDDADRMVTVSLRVLRLLVFLARLHYGPRPESQRNAVVDAAHRYMETHYAETLSLEDIASAVGVSREHLCRLFQEHLRTTPLGALRKMRCESACLRLANTREPMASISRAVGFGSAQNMNRAFRTVLGESPREYRRKMAMSR